MLEKKKIKQFKEGEYDHDSNSNFEACGLNKEHFLSKQDLFTTLGNGMDYDKNPLSQFAERLEERFTPREIAFLMAQRVFKGFEEAVDAEASKGKTHQ